MSEGFWTFFIFLFLMMKHFGLLLIPPKGLETLTSEPDPFGFWEWQKKFRISPFFIPEMLQKNPVRAVIKHNCTYKIDISHLRWKTFFFCKYVMFYLHNSKVIQKKFTWVYMCNIWEIIIVQERCIHTLSTNITSNYWNELLVPFSWKGGKSLEQWWEHYDDE